MLTRLMFGAAAFGLAGAITLPATTAAAATLVFSSAGVVSAVNGLEVAGTTYDVTFTGGYEASTWADVPLFTFTTWDAAYDAAAFLAAALGGSGVSSLSLANDGTIVQYAATFYGSGYFDAEGVEGESDYREAGNYLIGTYTLGYGAPDTTWVSGDGARYLISDGSYPFAAVWTVADGTTNPAPVPVPAALPLALAGLGMLGMLRRSHWKSA